MPGKEGLYSQSNSFSYCSNSDAEGVGAYLSLSHKLRIDDDLIVFDLKNMILVDVESVLQAEVPLVKPLS